jgi:glycosyltransferase involved in cell wall biosynthesis
MLRRCLESCAAQRHESVELIFVDNGSTDGSREAAEAFRARASFRMTIIDCAERGACAARNLGFEASHGSYIQWLDADDELANDKIALQVAALEAHADDDIAYGDWMSGHFRAGGVHYLLHPSWQMDDMLTELLADNWRPPCSYLLRRETAASLHAMRAFNPATPVLQDREYFTLAAIGGGRFRYVRDSLAIYNHWSPQQTSASHDAAQRASSLAALFERFREHAARQPAGRITALHRRFLDQSCALYRTPPMTGERLSADRKFMVTIDGVEQALSVVDAFILTSLRDAGAFTVETATNRLAGSGATACGIEIRRALDDLVGRGVLRRA